MNAAQLPDRFVGALDAVLRHRAAWLCACIALAALQLALIFTHEPWRDEWQALQIALQSTNLTVLFDNLRYEGHPPLWYLLLRAIGAVVGPYAALATSAALIALAGQATILALAPFSRAERILLVTGEFLLFEYFTISRSLTLGVLLVLAALALGRRRAAWIPIALLPLCDFQFGVISLGFVVLHGRDGNIWRPGAALWLVAGLLAAWSVRPAADLFTPSAPQGFLIETVGFLHRLGAALLPLQWNGGLRWDSPPPGILASIAGAGFLVLAWTDTSTDRMHRTLLFGFIVICWLFNCLVYPLSVRHVMLVAIVYVALRWISAPAGRRLVWRAWLIGASACGLATAAVALSMPFDVTAHVAHAIQTNGLADKRWMSFPSEHGQGVTALTGVAFERPERPCWQSFIRWDTHDRIDTPAELEPALRRALDRNGHFYLLSNQPLDLRSVPMRELGIFRPGFNKQGYALYEIGSALQAKRTTIPPCVAAQRPLAQR